LVGAAQMGLAKTVMTMKRTSHSIFAFTIFLAVTISVSAQSTVQDQSILRLNAVQSYWADPSTGLMWPTRDSDKDLSWKGSMKYCRTLRLSGFADWRLPNMAELQGIYDKNVETPGLAGYHNKQRPFTWHVKGGIFLTGREWSSNYVQDDRGRNSGYEMHFDFNSGESDHDPGDWPYPHDGMRALCVRGAGI